MRGERTRMYLGNVAGNVRRLRLQQRLTQQALAEAADLDLSFVQRVERAAENPSVDSLVRIADALGVSPGVLFHKAAKPTLKRGRPPKRK